MPRVSDPFWGALQLIVYLSHLQDIRKTLTQHTLVVFVISTTGQGDLPKNAQQLWRCLRKKNLPPTWLNSVNFTTFGLGDSSYSQ